MSLSTQIWERFCNCIKVQWVSLLKLENIVSFPWDPVDVPLTPWDPLELLGCPPRPPSTQKYPPWSASITWIALKITKGPTFFFVALSNMVVDPMGRPTRLPWPPGTPKTSLLTQKSNQITKGPIGHLDFTTVYHLSCFKAYHSVHFISRTFLGPWVLFRIKEKCHAQALFKYVCSSLKNGVTKAKNTIRDGGSIAQ